MSGQSRDSIEPPAHRPFVRSIGETVVGHTVRPPAPNPTMIYLDNQATTRVDPRVVAEMLPYLQEGFGNPHSTQHAVGASAKSAVDEARRAVADLCGATRDEIFFTSGATESNNMAIRGLAPFLQASGKTHVLCSAIEHKCVLASVDVLAQAGFDVEFVHPEANGIFNPAAVKALFRPTTGLLCLMSANNEIGTIEPIEEVARLCAEHSVAFHVDAAQSLGKHPFDVHALGFTTASFSAHKVYGPKGIGAIFIARKWRTRISPLIVGGGQEGGLRSGTLPVALCVGFGAACQIAAREMAVDAEHALVCRAAFLTALDAGGVAYRINGALEERLPGNLNLSIDEVDAEALIMTLKDRVALSTGSACTTAEIEPSHVLTALALPLERIEWSIRVSFGRFNTPDEARIAGELVAETAASLRRIRY